MLGVDSHIYFQHNFGSHERLLRCVPLTLGGTIESRKQAFQRNTKHCSAPECASVVVVNYLQRPRLCPCPWDKRVARVGNVLLQRHFGALQCDMSYNTVRSHSIGTIQHTYDGRSTSLNMDSSIGRAVGYFRTSVSSPTHNLGRGYGMGYIIHAKKVHKQKNIGIHRQLSEQIKNVEAIQIRWQVMANVVVL